MIPVAKAKFVLGVFDIWSGTHYRYIEIKPCSSIPSTRFFSVKVAIKPEREEHSCDSKRKKKEGVSLAQIYDNAGREGVRVCAEAEEE